MSSIISAAQVLTTPAARVLHERWLKLKAEGIPLLFTGCLAGFAFAGSLNPSN